MRLIPNDVVDARHGLRGEHGPVPAQRGHGGQAVRAAQRADHDAPAVGGDRRHHRRHRDPGGEPGVHQADHRADHRGAHRPERGDDLPGRRPGPLVHGRAGQGVRDGRPGRGVARRRAAGRFTPTDGDCSEWASTRFRTSSSAPRRASGRTTCSAGCCPSGSSSSARRSTTASPTSSSRSCSIWSRRARRARSRSTSTRPGGSFTSLMAIYDTMTFVRAPISTFCVGQAASTAAVLLAGGDPGRRFVLEHARVLLGQPASGGTAGDGLRPRPPGQGDGADPLAGRGGAGAAHPARRGDAAGRHGPRQGVHGARRRWRTGWPTRCCRGGSPAPPDAVTG